MEVSPEVIKQFADAVNTTSGSQMATIMIFGAFTVVALIGVIWGVISWRLKAIDKIEEKLEKLQEILTNMSSKLWSESSLDAKIENKVLAAIHEHEKNFHSHN